MFPVERANLVRVTTTSILAYPEAVIPSLASASSAYTTPKEHSANDAKRVSMETPGDRIADVSVAAVARTILAKNL